MTANQYKAALESLGLTRAEAADLLDISLRTSQSYAMGEYPIPKAVAIVLRALMAGKIRMEDVK